MPSRKSNVSVTANGDNETSTPTNNKSKESLGVEVNIHPFISLLYQSFPFPIVFSPSVSSHLFIYVSLTIGSQPSTSNHPTPRQRHFTSQHANPKRCSVSDIEKHDCVYKLPCVMVHPPLPLLYPYFFTKNKANESTN